MASSGPTLRGVRIERRRGLAGLVKFAGQAVGVRRGESVVVESWMDCGAHSSEDAGVAGRRSPRP